MNQILDLLKLQQYTKEAKDKLVNLKEGADKEAVCIVHEYLERIEKEVIKSTDGEPKVLLVRTKSIREFADVAVLNKNNEYRPGDSEWMPTQENIFIRKDYMPDRQYVRFEFADRTRWLGQDVIITRVFTRQRHDDLTDKLIISTTTIGGQEV